jgi:ribose 5-phosphate isomerase B
LDSDITMRIVIAADHAGYLLKEEMIRVLASRDYPVTDLGTTSTDPVDYPDFARAVGDAVSAGSADRGILICGSGVGVSVAANKIPGIRAGICHDCYSAHQGVEHDNMNVLVLGARVIGSELAADLVTAFLKARFTGEPRHRRRLEKVREIEREYCKQGTGDSG